MITLHDETWEFIAKTVTDLGKAILTVGFASYFFERLPHNTGCSRLAKSVSG